MRVGRQASGAGPSSGHEQGLRGSETRTAPSHEIALRSSLIAGSLLLAAATFVIDLKRPLGWGDATPYVLIVLLGLWLSPRFVVGAGVAGSVLTLLGALFSPAGGEPWRGAMHRGFTLVVLWLATVLVLRARRTQQHLEESLRQTHHLAAIVEHSADAIVGMTLGGIVTSWNPAAERLYGRLASEVIGRRADVLFGADDALRIASNLAPVAVDQAIRDAESTHRRPDGSEVEISLTISPVRDEADRLVGASAIARDITARRRAEEAVGELERRLRLVVSSAPVALWATDGHGTLTFAEGRAFDRLHPRPAELVGRSAFDEMPAPWNGDDLRRALQGEDFAATCPAGESWFEVHYAPLHDDAGIVTGVVGVSTDVTRRRRAEDAARQAHALARLGEMAATVAHEVRNPLAGMAGALQILRGRMPEGAPEREVAAQVLERIRSLNRLTQELLLFARPRSPRHERVRPVRLLREAAEALRSDVRFARLDITLDGSEVEIDGDGELLREAFLNVLLNAAQAMGGSGTVQATVEETDGRCDVHIRDQGPGVPEDLRRRIFEPFFTTRHRGTGLGLSIVKRTVEAHGGEVVASSHCDGGAAFKMSLPARSGGSTAR